MAITKQQKEATVTKLRDDLSKLQLAVLTDYRGLSVAEISELRAQLSHEHISYQVTKNTLLRLAIKSVDAYKDIDLNVFTGPMALAISTEDPVAPARIIFQYTKEHEALEIVGAITGDGRFLDPAEVRVLAKLPSREQLLGQLAGTLAAPLTGFIGVTGGNLRGLSTIFSAIKEAKE